MSDAHNESRANRPKLEKVKEDVETVKDAVEETHIAGEIEEGVSEGVDWVKARWSLLALGASVAALSFAAIKALTKINELEEQLTETEIRKSALEEELER